MTDYRLPIIKPVAIAKVKQTEPEINKKYEIINENKKENVINLTLSDSINLKESFGG